MRLKPLLMLTDQFSGTLILSQHLEHFSNFVPRTSLPKKGLDLKKSCGCGAAPMMDCDVVSKSIMEEMHYLQTRQALFIKNIFIQISAGEVGARLYLRRICKWLVDGVEEHGFIILPSITLFCSRYKLGYILVTEYKNVNLMVKRTPLSGYRLRSGIKDKHIVF